jgi:hypothetical protein
MTSGLDRCSQEQAPPGIDPQDYAEWYAAQSTTAKGLPCTEESWLLAPPGVDPDDFMEWWHDRHRGFDERRIDPATYETIDSV